MLKESLFVVLWKGFYLFFWGVGHRCTFGPGGFSFYAISTLMRNFVQVVQGKIKVCVEERLGILASEHLKKEVIGHIRDRTRVDPATFYAEKDDFDGGYKGIP
jgi:hypothetical protein